MVKRQLNARVDLAQTIKALVEVSNTNELVRKGRASHSDGTEVDPFYLLKGLKNVDSKAWGIKNTVAVSKLSQRESWKSISHLRDEQSKGNS